MPYSQLEFVGESCVTFGEMFLASPFPHLYVGELKNALYTLFSHHEVPASVPYFQKFVSLSSLPLGSQESTTRGSFSPRSEGEMCGMGKLAIKLQFAVMPKYFYDR